MFCPTCGNSLPDGAAFCPRCGCATSTGTPDSAFYGAAAREPFSFDYSWRAFKSFWTFKNWNVRATRTEYWSFFLWQFVLQTGALLLLSSIGALSTLAIVASAGSSVRATSVDASSFEHALNNVDVDESGTLAETPEPCVAPIGRGRSDAPFAAVSLVGSLALFLGIYSALSIAFVVPKFCATVRRLHDCGANGAFSVLLLVPSVSTLATIAIGLIDPTPGPNEFGANPRFAPTQAVQPPQEDAEPTSDASTRESAND